MRLLLFLSSRLQRTEKKKGCSNGPEARDAPGDGAPPSQVRLPPLMVLAHKLEVGPAVFLMLRAQFHQQGSQCLQRILPWKLSSAPGPFMGLLPHRLLSSWENPCCCSSSATTCTSSMTSSASSWNNHLIPTKSPSTRGSPSSTASTLHRVATLPGMTTCGFEVPASKSLRMAGCQLQRPETGAHN